MSDDDRTADELFGTTPPGTPVKAREPRHLEGYGLRRNFRYRADGRAYPDSYQEPIETTLPASQLPHEEEESAVPDINASFPSNYLKASDLQGRSAVVTIDRVEFEPVGRDREMKAVIYFIGKQKGVVLNKTNAKKITEISGSALTEEWHGVAIVLYPTETEFAGETVECIRIKAVQKSGMQRMTPLPPPPPPKADDNADAPLTENDIPF